jgi:hypothetical protein
MAMTENNGKNAKEMPDQKIMARRRKQTQTGDMEVLKHRK